MEPEIAAGEIAKPAVIVSERKRFAALAGPKTAVGRQQERLGWLLVLPSLIVVFAVAIYPLYETFRLSFTNTRLASAREVQNVGLGKLPTPLWRTTSGGRRCATR